MFYLNFEAQGRGSTFTFCYAYLNKTKGTLVQERE